MKKIKQISILLVLCTTLLHAQGKMSLEQCIAYGIENNITLQQMQGNKEILQTDTRLIKNSRLPQAEVGLSQRFNIGRSINRDNLYEDVSSHITNMSLNVEMPLFDGFATKYQLKANEANIRVSEAEINTKREELILNITNLFYRTAIYKEILETIKEQKKLSIEQIKFTKKKIEAGVMSRHALAELEAQLASDEFQITEAEGNIEFALIELAQLMNYNDNIDKFDIQIDTVTDTNNIINHSYISDTGLFPQIKVAQYQIESEKWNYKKIKNQLLPLLSVGSSIGSSYYKHSGIINAPFKEQFKNNQQTYIYASLSIPIFEKFNTRNSFRRKKIEIRNYTFSLQEVRNNLLAEILKSRKELSNAHQKVTAAQKTLQAREEAYQYSVERFRAGKLSVYELLQTSQKLTESRSQTIQTKYELAYKQKVYEYYMRHHL